MATAVQSVPHAGKGTFMVKKKCNLELFFPLSNSGILRLTEHLEGLAQFGTFSEMSSALF